LHTDIYEVWARCQFHPPTGGKISQKKASEYQHQNIKSSSGPGRLFFMPVIEALNDSCHTSALLDKKKINPFFNICHLE